MHGLQRRLEHQGGELAEMKQRLEAAATGAAAQQAAAKEAEEKLEQEIQAERETAAELALSMQVRNPAWLPCVLTPYALYG